ncbi:MAG TPA: hypothetical protein VEP73_07795 [Actinomycetota bacterium]|nr:hypothetical protein [Actinomycetota bacterium]
MNQRVLLVGRSRRVLSKLTSALTEAGFDAQWTEDPATASQRVQPPSVDLVAFGRGVGSQDRISQQVATGMHSIPLGRQAAGQGPKFAVVRVDATEVSIVKL